MLDYFSRIYFVGVLIVVTWSYRLIIGIVLGVKALKVRSHNFNESAYSKLERMNRNLHSIFPLAVTCTSGCCVNQIFGVWFAYIARVTDANPFFAFHQAWTVTQVLLCLLVSLDAVRRYASATLERHRPELAM
jgi:hypothetical protein